METEELVISGIMIVMTWMWYRADKRATDWQKIAKEFEDLYDKLMEQYNINNTHYESMKKISAGWEGLCKDKGKKIESLYTTIAAMETAAKIDADPDKEMRTH